MQRTTDENKSKLHRLREQFSTFLEERMPVLTDFVERVGLPSASMVLVEADSFIPAVSEFMENQTVEAEDRKWILTRIGYLIGEWFVQRHGGVWFLDEVATSRYFCRYVVGKFLRLSNHRATLDPFELAELFLNSPCPRDLVGFLSDVEAELLSVLNKS